MSPLSSGRSSMACDNTADGQEQTREAKRQRMIQWKPIGEYIEPNWVKLGTALPPVLFWRPKKGATLGYIRDGELFDAKWVYVCDSNKVSDFSTINGPDGNVIDLDAHRAEA
jgi:hypothetical protein